MSFHFSTKPLIVHSTARVYCMFVYTSSVLYGKFAASIPTNRMVIVIIFGFPEACSFHAAFGREIIVSNYLDDSRFRSFSTVRPFANIISSYIHT